MCCVSDRAGVSLPHHGPAGVLLPLRPATKRLPRRLQAEHQRQRIDALHTQPRPTGPVLAYGPTHNDKYTLTAYTKYKLNTLNYAYNASMLIFRQCVTCRLKR